ncbi:MAG: hypothetical protein HN348_13790 [Proteobacteria bacterium]|jgi:hypothetical protein|nr:hypothetical protein [Pseudomonadota bacterium]
MTLPAFLLLLVSLLPTVWAGLEAEIYERQFSEEIGNHHAKRQTIEVFVSFVEEKLTANQKPTALLFPDKPVLEQLARLSPWAM